MLLLLYSYNDYSCNYTPAMIAPKSDASVQGEAQNSEPCTSHQVLNRPCSRTVSRTKEEEEAGRMRTRFFDKGILRDYPLPTLLCSFFIGFAFFLAPLFGSRSPDPQLCEGGALH